MAAADCSSSSDLIKPLIRADYNINTITAISEAIFTESSLDQNATNATTTVLINNKSSTPIFLLEQPSVAFLNSFNAPKQSEYSVKGLNSNQEDQSCMIANIINDLGYYGSSDYSENNSFGVLCQKKIKSNQHQRVFNPNQHTVGTNSSSSFTSSSILSSPSSNTDSSTSRTGSYLNIKQYPVITNLYPLSTYQSNNSTDCDKVKNMDVNIYLEKFERIYNSDPLNHKSINNELPCQKSLGSFNSKSCQRNSGTTYSYV